MDGELCVLLFRTTNEREMCVSLFRTNNGRLFLRGCIRSGEIEPCGLFNCSLDLSMLFIYLFLYCFYFALAREQPVNLPLHVRLVLRF